MVLSLSSSSRVRIRDIGPVGRRITGDAYQKIGTNPATLSKPGSGSSNYARGTEVTEDDLHPVFALAMSEPAMLDAMLKNPLFRYLQTGGPFTSTKILFEETGKFVDTKTSGYVSAGYRGWVSPTAPGNVTTFPSPSTDASLRELGAKYIRDFMPGKPIAELAQGIAEIKREGLPSFRLLNTYKQRDFRTLGNDHLNAEFGWKPIISSIYDAAEAVDRGDAVWSQYVKQGNKLVRRNYRPPVERTTVTENLGTFGGLWPPELTSLGLASGATSACFRTREISVRRNFSAAYKYYVPVGDQKTAAAARQALKLRTKYGLDVDPALLWELTPWSWFVDWFVPVGKTLEAFSDLVLGNTALPWAYISEHYVVRDTYTRPGASMVGSSPSSVGSLVVKYDYKRRIPASPFGFQIAGWDGFTPKQLAILAALGVTR